MYQSKILGDNDVVEVQLWPEVGPYWSVVWRVIDPAFPHRNQWKREEHLTQGQAIQTALSVLNGFSDDWEAQGYSAPM